MINDVYIPDFAINRRFFSLTGLQNYQFPIYLDKSGFIDIQLIISELNRDQYNWIPLFIDTQFGVVKKNITLERSIKKKYLINETIDYSGLYSENKAIIKSLISSNFLFTDYDFNISGIIITGVDAYSGKAIDDITGFYNNETNDLESGRYSGFYSGFYSEQSSGFYSGFLYDEITELYSGVYSDNYNDFPSGFYSGFYSGLAFVAKYTRPVNDIYVSNGESALMPNVFYDGHISGISCLVLKNEKYTNTGSFILDSQPKNRLYLSTVIGFDNTLSYPLTGEFLYRFRAFYSDNDYATFTGGFSIEYLNSNEIKINKK